MRIKSFVGRLSLSVVLLTAAVGGTPTASAAGTFNVTVEQEQEVKQAVLRLKESGLMAPLEQAPDVCSWDKVLVSDAVSVVEVAYVDFIRRVFFLNVKNPWTNAEQWYGPFSLDTQPAHL